MALLEITGIRKRFGRTDAVAGASVTIHRGEAVALVGENGAGKSTLMRIVTGLLRPDRGEVRVDGTAITGPESAARAGIRMVHQHFNLAGALTVAENLVLHETTLPAAFGHGAIARAAEAMVARSGMSCAGLDRRAATLSVGEMARVEMIRALAREPRILILDEPTSVLTPAEVNSLLHSLRALAAEGLTVVLISHKLEEVFAFARRIVVMREGRIVLDTEAHATSREEVARSMIGRDLETVRTAAQPPRAAPRLALRDVTTAPAASRVPLRGVSLECSAGEIVAVVGVAGNGQNALADVLRGLEAATGGRIELDGRPADAATLFAAPRVAHIPSDRTRAGVVGELTVAENLALRSGSTGRRALRAAQQAVAHYQIRGAPDQPAAVLSGGNQQKVLLARELSDDTHLIVASEPTRGLDFEAAHFVHERLRRAAGRGAAFLLITSDLDEAATLADSIHVMSAGRLSERLPVSTPAEELGLRMAGAR